MRKITDIAKVIRSKNSSPFDLTLDIIIKTKEYYNCLKDNNAITRELIAKIYGVNIDDVGEVIWFDPANAVKIGLRRPITSGAPGDSDVYGAQQHAPLLDLEFDI